MRQQLFKGQALLSWMGATAQFVHCHVRGWAVQQAQGLVDIHTQKAAAAQRNIGEQLARIHHGQYLADKAPHPALAEAFGDGIDWCQVLVQGCLGVLAVFRMVQLQPCCTAPHLTKTTQPGGILETCLLLF